MKKLLLLLLLCSPALAQIVVPTAGQTAVTGNVRDLGASNLSGVTVRFYLRGCGGNQPRVTGVGTLSPSSGSVWYKDFVSDVNGLITGALYATRDAAGTGNGSIECGGSYTAEWYGLVVIQNGKAGPEMPVQAKNGATIDISNITPITVNPVIMAPTGDTVYARLDGGNQGFLGPIQAPSFTGPLTGNVTGDITSTGTSTIKRINGIRYADQFSGADIGAKINAAYADLPATGGTVRVPAGSYTFSTGITISTAAKPVRIIGDPDTVLTYTGTGTAFLFNSGTASGSYDNWSNGLENFHLVGPGGVNGGVGNAGIAIQIGDTTHANMGFYANNIVVAGFTTGITWGNINAWGTKVDHSAFVNNTKNLLFNLSSAGGQENVEFVHVVFGQFGTPATGVALSGTGVTEMNFIDCSFDGDLVSLGGSTSNRVNFLNPHFENPGGNTTTAFLTITAGNISLINPTFQEDTATATVPSSFIAASGGNLLINGLVARAQTAPGNVANYLNLSGTASLISVGPIELASVGAIANTSTGGGMDCNLFSGFCQMGTSSFPVTVSASTLLANNLQANTGLKVGASGSTIADSRELVQSAHSCGTGTTCANTANGSNRTIFGSVALVSGTPSAVTVSGISPAFTSASTYFCTATPQGATSAIAAGGIAVTNVSGSSFTLTGPATVSTVINYQCIGN